MQLLLPSHATLAQSETRIYMHINCIQTHTAPQPHMHTHTRPHHTHIPSNTATANPGKFLGYVKENYSFCVPGECVGTCVYVFPRACSCFWLVCLCEHMSLHVCAFGESHTCFGVCVCALFVSDFGWSQVAGGVA